MGARLALITAILCLAGALLRPAGSAAQQVPDACTVPLAPAQGGDVIRLSTIQLTMPPGYTYQWGPFVQTGSVHIRVCVIQYGSEVTINAATGLETARVVKNAAAGPVLDAIVASAVLIAAPGAPTFTPTPTPTPIPTATPVPPPTAIVQSESGATGSGGTSTIRPPSTGDGGLRR